MSGKQKRWEPEPVHNYGAPLFGGPDPHGERVYPIKQAVKATGLPEKVIRQEIEHNLAARGIETGLFWTPEGIGLRGCTPRRRAPRGT